MIKNQEDNHARKQSPTITGTQNEYFRRSAPTRRPPIPRYQKNFFGLCYSCNNYGNKVVDYKACAYNINTWSRNSYDNSRYPFEGNYFRNTCEAFEINNNIFRALNYGIKFYNCNNYGHIAKN